MNDTPRPKQWPKYLPLLSNFAFPFRSEAQESAFLPLVWRFHSSKINNFN